MTYHLAVCPLANADSKTTLPGTPKVRGGGCGHPPFGDFEPSEPLLYFDRRARFGELLLDILGLFLRDAFFHRLGRAVDQILGFLQAQAGDFTNRFDDVDL